jgi:quinol monooxygenase YgiN
MGRFVITVDFQLHAGAVEKFLPIMVDNANKSRTLEPGCDRFDVLLSAAEPDRVFLYEVYKDRAAFQAHLKTAHFLEFNTASAPFVKDKKIGELNIENDDGR